MDLIPAIGFRWRYTWKEVCGFLGMTRKQLDWLVYGNHALRKRYAGQYPSITYGSPGEDEWERVH